MTRSLIVAALLVVVGYASPAAAESRLRAGAAVVDITPAKLPVSMIGSFALRQATSVHDPLRVRCLVLDDGTTKLAIVTADSCIIARETFDAAKQRAAAKTGIPASNMLMSATHTHSGATAMDLGNFTADKTYVELLTTRLAEAVEQAAAKLEPAELGYGAAPLASEVFNRRWKMKPGSIVESPVDFREVPPDQVMTNPGAENPNLEAPAGPIDPDVMVLAVRTAAGKPLGVYAVYSLHYVGGIPTGALSADYFGEFAERLREKLGVGSDESFVALLANGTSGDINNVDVRKRRPKQEPFEQVRVVADRTADVAATVYRRLRFRSDVKLGATERSLKLGVRKPSQVELATATFAIKQHDALVPPDRPNAVLDRQRLYMQEWLKLGDFPEQVDVKLQVLHIGGLTTAAIPCEPFAEIGLEIKRKSLGDTFVVGLANGYYGYLPTPEQHRLGGYETWLSRWSYLEVEASTKISDALVEMIGEKK